MLWLKSAGVPARPLDLRQTSKYYSVMSHLCAAELKALKAVAREIHDTAEEAGFTVEAAIAQNKAFRRFRGPASALERSLVLDAARRGASQAGAGVDEVPGGGLDVVTSGGDAIRRFRVKRVTVTQSGELSVVCGAGSSLLVAEPEGLLRQERWVLGFVTSDDHTIERLLAAEVVDWEGEGPYRLIFGTVIELDDEQPPGGFKSSEELLEGFDEDEGLEDADAG
jgi:hypothetical protein